MRSGLIALCSALLVAGCASVETRHPISSANTSQGTSYHLARGQLRLKVTDVEGTLNVLVEGPEVSADPDGLMFSNVATSGTSDNHVKINVDKKTNLLEKVEVTSVGRLTDILSDLTKSVVMLQGSETAVSNVIFDRLYDVDQISGAAAEANGALERYFASRCSDSARARLTDSRFVSVAKGANADALPSIVARRKQCAGLVDAGAENATSRGGLIRISVSGAARSSGTSNAGSAIDFSKCLRGICYRPYTSITVTLTVRGAFERSGAFLMPNPNVLAFINLTQGVFATQKYTIEFGDGVPTQLDQDSKSELVGLAKLPVDLLTVILSAPGEALGLKKKALQDEDAYLDVVKASVAKRDEVAGICARSKALCPSTAYRILGGAVNPSTDNGQSERADDGADGDQMDEPADGSTDDVPGDD